MHERASADSALRQACLASCRRWTDASTTGRQERRAELTITHPFTVPFEEDDKDPRTWFLDHNYIEAMNDMFKKVNGKSSFSQQAWAIWTNALPLLQLGKS